MGKLRPTIPLDMKRQNENLYRHLSVLIFGASALSFALAPQVHAQSADIFTEGQTESAVGSSEEEKEPEPVDERPSRFAGADIEAYTASRAAVFSMRNRKTDPFGLNQDPSVKPAVRKIASKLPVKRQIALPPKPLSDISETDTSHHDYAGREKIPGRGKVVFRGRRISPYFPRQADEHESR